MTSGRLVLLLLVTLSAAVTKCFEYESSTNFFELLHREPPPSPPSISNKNLTTQEFWMRQRLDHFNLLDDRTWYQRYFLSSDLYVPGGPIFLYLSGEWEAFPSAVTDRFITDLAEQHCALLINLEHRYYGQSRPTGNTTTSNLKYLSTDQALEDTAAFAMELQAESELNLTGPWIIFGGSYSAQLAAWSRAKYPHLFYAAYASSAPVYAQLDIPEYMEVVNDALYATSPVCTETITAAMDELRELVNLGNETRISELFKLCGTINLNIPENIMSVYTYITLFFSYEVQYAKLGNLENICNTLTEGTESPLETLAKIIRNVYTPSCLVASAELILTFFRNDIHYNNGVLHQFYYQMCTEYGHYMSVTSPDQPFGQIVPVEYFLLWCPEVYGPEFTREVNEAGVQRINLLYGGYSPDVTRVIYTHGSLDPWHPFGILQDLGPDTPSIVIEGESHCRDMERPSDLDSQPLKDARIRITQIIADWLAARNN